MPGLGERSQEEVTCRLGANGGKHSVGWMDWRGKRSGSPRKGGLRGAAKRAWCEPRM